MLYLLFFHLYFSIFLTLTLSSTSTSTSTLISVLLRVSNYVRGKSLPSIFTFKKELVVNWLADAKVRDDCWEIQEKKRKFVHKTLRNYKSLKGINFLAFFLTILPSYLPFNLFPVRISFPLPFHVTFLTSFFRSFLLISFFPSFLFSFLVSLIPSFIPSSISSFMHSSFLPSKSLSFFYSSKTFSSFYSFSLFLPHVITISSITFPFLGYLL